MSLEDDLAWQSMMIDYGLKMKAQQEESDKLEREHDIATESLVEFLIKLGCTREEALSIIEEADRLIESGEFD